MTPVKHYETTVEGADYRLPISNIAGWITANDRAGGNLYHARRRLIQAWRMSGEHHARDARLPRLERAHIVAELCFTDKRRRDPANWYPTVKAAVDGLVDAGVLRDDSTEYLVGPDMRLGPPVPRSNGRKQGGGVLVLHIFELPAMGQEVPC